MAHELHTENGKYSMFYCGAEPWHGLGQKLRGPATAQEAIKAAQLGWKVIKRPVFAAGDGVLCPVPDKFAVMRADRLDQPDCPIFGVVGREYTPLQNHEAFQFFDEIVGRKEAIYHTAGYLGDGSRIWILAKLPDCIKVKRDVAEKYLLLSNSHDGSSTVHVKFTPIRVVCQNTLTMALSRGETVRVPHTPDVRERLRQAQDLLGIIRREFAVIEENFTAMADVALDGRKLDEYLCLVFPDPAESAARGDGLIPASEDILCARRRDAQRRMEANRAWGRHFFEHGEGNQQEGIRGTLWAAYNGVAELIDHRASGLNAERRLRSAWFGQGYLTKARAYRIAVDNMKAWKN